MLDNIVFGLGMQCSKGNYCKYYKYHYFHRTQIVSPLDDRRELESKVKWSPSSDNYGDSMNVSNDRTSYGGLDDRSRPTVYSKSFYYLCMYADKYRFYIII